MERGCFQIVRKGKNKLTQEKGQNLKPFLLSLMANVLYDANQSSVDSAEREDE